MTRQDPLLFALPPSCLERKQIFCDHKNESQTKVAEPEAWILEDISEQPSSPGLLNFGFLIMGGKYTSFVEGTVG